MRVFILHSIIFTFCSFALLGGVAGNPFLRPTAAPPPKSTAPPPPPKPQVNPSLAKEVQFRGYFLYKGAPHFCIFNTKSNHGEWIRLNEKTFEEFEAHSFDLEAENLTLRFNGQEIILSLHKSTTGGANSTSPTSVPRPNPSSFSANSKPASSTPKVMPPRPRVRPKLPDWLANRTVNRASPSASFTTSSRSNFSPYAVLPSGGQPLNNGTNLLSEPTNISPSKKKTNQLTQFNSPLKTNPAASKAIFSGTQSMNDSGDSSTLTSAESNSVDLGGNALDDEQSGNISTNNDLEGLPPPPPPPNILPPGPPPNILPSRDD